MLICDRTQPRHYGDEHGRYWSVSQVCDVVCGVSRYYAPGSDERGTDVHLIFALAVGHSVGLCDAPDVPREYQGYYRGIMGFIEKYAPRPSGIERARKHPTLPVAGTIDFAGMIQSEFVVLDFKTGVKERRHKMQIEAYAHLVGPTPTRQLLYINGDGEYEYIRVKKLPGDWAAFQNGLSILQWREQR